MKTRGWIILGITVWIFIGSVMAALATQSERDYQLRGYRDATTDINLPYRVPRLGVNAELSQYSPQELIHNLDLMVNANVHWVRQLIRWDEIEPEPGHYQWDVLDQIIPVFVQYPTLSLVPVLVNSPEWATESGTVTAPPKSVNDYVEFVTQFTERYGDYVDYYQVWDEPNIQLGWGGSYPNATEYGVLLQSAYEAIHQIDPTANVIAAALAPNVETGPQNIGDVQYLEQLYQLGLPQFADVIAAKPYGFDFSPYDRDVDPQKLNFSHVILLREVMEKNGDGTRPLWASNWGWNSLPDDWQDDLSVWGTVTEAQRIDYTLDGLHRAEDEWPWLGAMILQHWQPQASVDDPIWGFSLLDSEGNPQSLYNNLAAYNSSQVAANNGLYPAVNPYARYQGIWEFSDLGADIGWVQDSRLEFDFTGASVSLVVRRGDYVGYLYPQIDDFRLNAIPHDVDGHPYISLRSANLDTITDNVLIAKNLPPEVHTLTVVADELVPDEVTNRWPLIGYAVSSGDLTAPYNRQITTAVIAAVLSGLSALVMSWFTGLTLPFRSLSRLGILSIGAIQIVLGALSSLALMFGTYLIYSDSVPHWFKRDSVQLGLSILTSGFIYLNPGAILTLVALFVLFILILNRLELGLALIIFWVPFFLFPVELFQFFFPTAELIFYISLVAWFALGFYEYGKVLRGVASEHRVALPNRMSIFDWMVFVWIALGIIAVFNSKYTSLAVTEFRTVFAQPTLFYLMLRTVNLDRRRTLLLIDALILSAVAVSAIGLVMWVDGNIIQAEEGTRRLQSVYGSPNNVALLLGRALPFVLAMLFIQLDRRRITFVVLSITVISIALLLTQSAGALFIGVPLSVLTVVILRFRKRAVVPVFVLLCLFCGSLVIASQTPRFERMTNITEGTNFYRIRVWQSTFNILEDHPIAGIGLDQFLYEFRDRYMMPDAWKEPDLSHPHNIFLDFWTRLGFAGLLYLLVLIGILVKTIKVAYQTTKLDHLDFGFVVLVGSTGSLVNLITHGQVDNSVFVLDLSYIFFLLLAFLAALPNNGAIDS